MGNGNGGREGNARVDWEFERRKKFQLAFRQAGQIDRRARPLSKRHCLVIAALAFLLAVAIVVLGVKF